MARKAHLGLPKGRTKEELDIFIKKLELQAKETAEERIPLYLRVGVKDADLILDVGCGSGMVTRDLANLTKGEVFAMDESEEMIKVARNVLKDFDNVHLLIGDAHSIPFKDDTFDITTCNLLLMWSTDPQRVVNEMRRVTRKGGIVLASLEPDFGGKVHWPENPKVDKIFAGEAIKRRGGDPYIGRKLRQFFVRAGLETEIGIGNSRIWSCEEDKAYYLHSRDYYVRVLREAGLSEEEIDQWEYEYLKSLDEGIELNFFPQFYAIGRKV
ncbi:MAG: ubiquinone/menaquinone biosynthesis protein [Thermoplasmata archaeon]|nr:MAG: ubiquinone/menaquinone biosynthesis protein [Thermoplasmata archaeon]HDO69183.1 methyltransferase domain-containing protein [Thermoplasmatales archaeon]HEX17098.1 methyltransferase domain-containing protein [Thermoplasmatales archaeon]